MTIQTKASHAAHAVPDGPTHAFTTEALAAARAEVKARRSNARAALGASPDDNSEPASQFATMMQQMQQRYLTRAAAVSPRGSTCTESAASSARSSCSSSSSSTVHSSPGVINGAFVGELPLLTLPKPASATDAEGHPVYSAIPSSRGSSSSRQQPRAKPKWQEPKSAMLNKQLKAARESKKPLSLEERKKARRRLCETKERPAARVYGS